MTTENREAESLPPLKAEARNLDFYYGAFQALKGINMPIYEKRVTSLIGPSGCGKSTFLRCFNRMHDLYPGNRYEGAIDFHPEVFQLVCIDPAFQESARVNARRTVALDVQQIPRVVFGRRTPEVVETDVVQRCRTGKTGDMPTQRTRLAIGAHHHRHRVPADD